MTAKFDELPSGAMTTANQAAAALANVAVYCEAFGTQIVAKAQERGIDTDDMYAIAALQHISDVCAEAATHHAEDLGNELRRIGFAHGKQPAYHVMNAEQALAVEGDQRAMCLAGAMPVDPSGGV